LIYQKKPFMTRRPGGFATKELALLEAAINKTEANVTIVDVSVLGEP
jgi:hypothetical protein